MRNSIDVEIKDFFTSEVSCRTTPPLPVNRGKKRFKVENLFLAACIAGCLFCLIQPAVYTNVLRKTAIPHSTYRMLRDDFTRVVFDASQEYKNNKGVSYD